MIAHELEMMYNDWIEIQLIQDKQYKCICKCGNEEEHSTEDLMYDKTRSCTECLHKNNSEKQREKLEGNIYGKWLVKNYIGNRKYRCLCLGCNTEYEVSAPELKRGKTKQCKRCAGVELKDLTGKKFGCYEVIEYAGNHYWKCRCTSCGKIKNVTSQHLTLQRNSKCISCSNKVNGSKLLEKSISDLVGKQIWNLEVTGYNYASNKYICMCMCENKTILEVSRSNIQSGKVKSCGCLTNTLKNNTMIERYGDIASKRIGNPRSVKDICELMDKKSFIERCNRLSDKLGRVPNSLDIANEFDITTSIALKYAHLYNVDVDTDTGSYSVNEEEIASLIVNNPIIKHDRKIIYPQELDIVIPNRNTAIEVNGSYWHSSLFTDKYYHQNKSTECFKKGIHLIHIFEHEWNNQNTRDKLIKIIRNIDGTKLTKVRASDTEVCNISAQDTKDFLDKYHLQNNVYSEIRLALQYKGITVAVMTFGKPRFNSNYQYELIRYCANLDYIVYGAASKLFKFFIDNYNPESVITYCDISKFNGNTYKSLGFNEEKLTEPNYIWVNSKLQTMTRYQTQKHKLVEAGLGTNNQTEVEIMEALGYFKVYDCGNRVFTWDSKSN